MFNEQTGSLDSWTITGNNGERTELRFLELELNKPIPSQIFIWSMPKGARQVTPEETEQKVNSKPPELYGNNFRVKRL